MIATSDVLLTLAASAPAAFALGLIVGFVLSDRYRITRRRTSDTDKPDRRQSE